MTDYNEVASPTKRDLVNLASQHGFQSAGGPWWVRTHEDGRKQLLRLVVWSAGKSPKPGAKLTIEMIPDATPAYLDAREAASTSGEQQTREFMDLKHISLRTTWASVVREFEQVVMPRFA